MPEILSRQNDGRWWSKYADGVMVWAAGESASRSDAALVGMVPTPYEAGPEQARIVTAEVDGLAYASYFQAGMWAEVVATAPTEEEAAMVLMLHVPVPQPTESAGEEPPPKLEDHPLPPV